MKTGSILKEGKREIGKEKRKVRFCEVFQYFKYNISPWVQVLTALRSPEIVLPEDWDTQLLRQQTYIVTWLLGRDNIIAAFKHYRPVIPSLSIL